MRVLLLYNAPLLDKNHCDSASESGVIESVDAIAQSLLASKHEVSRLALAERFEPLLKAVEGPAAPEVIINLCESFAGSSAGEAHLAGLLELVGIPYTGSPPETLALVRQKAPTKWLLQGAGLPTADFTFVSRDQTLAADEFARQLAQGPLFVKPAGEDASLGIAGDCVVVELPKLMAKVADLQRRYGDVLVERYIDGREFNTSIIALPKPHVMPLAEVNFSPDADCPWPVVTYDAKWTPDSSGWRATPVTCPAQVDDALAARIREVSLAAFQITGCRDYARVDLRVNPQGQVCILEVNANPDIGPQAGFARAIGAAGISYQEFVGRLIETARRRGREPG